MTIAETARREGFFALLQNEAVTFQLADTGLTFVGVITNDSAIIPPEIIGEDRREKACVEVDGLTNPNLPSFNSFVIDDSNQQWQVISRENNPADFTVKFWLAKTVTGKDVNP